MKWMKTWLLLILPNAVKIVFPFYAVMSMIIFAVFVVTSFMLYFGSSVRAAKASGIIVFVIGLAIWDATVGFRPKEGFGLSKAELEKSSIDTSSFKFDFLYGATIIVVGLPLPLLMTIAMIHILNFAV